MLDWLKFISAAHISSPSLTRRLTIWQGRNILYENFLLGRSNQGSTLTYWKSAIKFLKTLTLKSQELTLTVGPRIITIYQMSNSGSAHIVCKARIMSTGGQGKGFKGYVTIHVLFHRWILTQWGNITGRIASTTHSSKLCFVFKLNCHL